MKKIETLKLDYDKLSFRKIYKIFEDNNRWIAYFFKLKVLDIRVFKTKNGYHIYIEVNNRLSNKDICFLQLALGSDFRRECYYWKRIKYPILSNRQWNILFFEKVYSKKSKQKRSIEIFSNKKSNKLLELFPMKNAR